MAMLDSIEMDKLSYEIFSILENKFLFGGGFDHIKTPSSLPQTPIKTPIKSAAGKVRILSIDASPSDGGDLLAAAALSRLESSLRARSGDPNARIADFFDAAAGSGTGGVLAALIFTRGPDGRPLLTADDALSFLSRNPLRKKGILGRIFRQRSGIFRRVFGESTLRDAVKPLLIPCHDLLTGSPLVFSRSDAVETDAYDFRMTDVCAATCADRTINVRSVDGRTAIAAVGGWVAMGNPTAAAITHVLNNKMEFPLANGVEDLLVLSLSSSGDADAVNSSATPSRKEMLRIAGNGVSDTVDQAVAMAFAHNRTSNYLRIQANGLLTDHRKSTGSKSPINRARDMLAHRNVESILFQGKKVSQLSNAEKMEQVCGDLIKEQERRKSNQIPTVLVKQQPFMTPPRSSSATTFSSTTTVANSSSSIDC